jgi:type I restriction enzyme M protein
MNLSSFIWSVADLLRGKYKPHEYGRVILPFTVLRRMDCVLEPTKQAVLKEARKRESPRAAASIRSWCAPPERRSTTHRRWT